MQAIGGAIAALATGTLEGYVLDLRARRKIALAARQALRHIRVDGWLKPEDFRPGIFDELVSRLEEYAVSPRLRPGLQGGVLPP